MTARSSPPTSPAPRSPAWASPRSPRWAPTSTASSPPCSTRLTSRQATSMAGPDTHKEGNTAKRPSAPPDLADVLAAPHRIAPYLGPTPLYRYPALDAMTGAQEWDKHENHQPVGAFKVRGGVNLVSHLDHAERPRRAIPPSTPTPLHP